MRRSKPAFTLIELLVVIAIIGLLATLSVIALSSARAKSRDSKRLADIRQMQTSLALYYDQADHYPTTDEFNSGSISATSSSNGKTTYMHIIPAAPVPNDGPCSASGNGYIYTPTDGGASYTLSFCIGGPSNNLVAGSKCATPGGILSVDCNGSAGGNGGGSCTPNYCLDNGYTCGSDTCGGSCGSCTSPDVCASGSCCTPYCEGNGYNCGDNGCGGSCGTCPSGQTCGGGGTYGQCGCTPNYCLDNGYTCGSDTCGGSCGSCTSPDVCASGSCCTPDCSGGNECGDDGCGSPCGTCTGNNTCGGGGNYGQCGCTAEDDTAFCSRLDKACGSVTAADNCGLPRTVADCGACTSPQTCAGSGVANQCGCTPETDTAFCSRLDKNCGSVTAADNCGLPRTVADCGACTSPQTCQDNDCAYLIGASCTGDGQCQSGQTCFLDGQPSGVCVNKHFVFKDNFVDTGSDIVKSVSGNTVITISNSGSLLKAYTININNNNHTLTPLGSIDVSTDIPGGILKNAYLDGNYVYAAVYASSKIVMAVYAFDGSFTYLTQGPLISGTNVMSFGKDGNYIYTFDGNKNMRIYTLSGSTLSNVTNSPFSISSGGGNRFYVKGNYAYIPMDSSGLGVYSKYDGSSFSPITSDGDIQAGSAYADDSHVYAGGVYYGGLRAYTFNGTDLVKVYEDDSIGYSSYMNGYSDYVFNKNQSNLSAYTFISSAFTKIGVLNVSSCQSDGLITDGHFIYCSKSGSAGLDVYSFE